MLKRLAPLALLIGIVSLALVACGGDDEADADAPAAAAAAPAAPAAGQPAAQAGEGPTPEPTRPAGTGITKREGNLVDFTVSVVGGGGTTGQKSNTYGAVPFQFHPTEMIFKVGDVVTFTAIPTDDAKQQHTFSVTDLNAIAYMKYGNTGTVTVTFDKAGQFKYRCDIHTGEGMNGVITVQ